MMGSIEWPLSVHDTMQAETRMKNMKQWLRFAGAACVVIIAVSVGSGFAYLNKPLNPGHSSQGGEYRVKFSQWPYWYFGASVIELLAMPTGGKPCTSTPVARVINLGPVSIARWQSQNGNRVSHGGRSCPNPQPGRESISVAIVIAAA